MGIKNFIKKTANKASNTISKASSLCDEQLQSMQEKREQYLSEMPSPSDDAGIELTNRLLAASSVEIYNAYLSQIEDLYIPIERKVEYEDEFNDNYNIRYINITKWVKDKKENSLEKLVNVYEVLSNEECNIALVFHKTIDRTEVYLAVTNTKNAKSNIDVDSYMNRIKGAIKGNFPGSEWNKKTGVGIIPYLNNIEHYSVASATNIPTEKSDKFISQTIEKLLDGIVPENDEQEYTIILLATPVQDVETRKLQLGKLYSGLAPYSSWSTNYTFTELDATGSSATVGVNVGASAGIQSGQNQASSISDGQTDSVNDGVSDSLSDTESNSTTHTDGKNVSSSKTKGSSDSGGISLKKGIGLNYNHALSKSKTNTIGSNVSDAVQKGASKTIGKAVSKTLGKAVTNSVAKTSGIFKGANFGGNFGMNFARSSNITATIGKNEGITQSYTNYNIKHTLQKLEEQMKRLEQSTALGLWDFAAYVLSEDMNVANNVAHSYLALTQGKESHMSESAINLWRGDMGDKSGNAKEICDYLKEFRHPLFGLNPSIVETDSEFLIYPSIVTATTSLTGKELAYSLNFPQKSVTGLPVIECAEFGRNVITYDCTERNNKKIELGKIFHMNQEEPTDLNLDLNSLSSHTFITGSTGAGKSNTIYQIINEAKEQGVNFLVIEPAKGEYKQVFGQDQDVNIYGTNPKLMPLLKLNPFSFPEGIHVLEHIDRLIEIFNVCWPMYAAMPAVLKNAIEVSYMDCGWDLITSENKYNNEYYPTFRDICKNIKIIINSSEYDNENKGAYKGSLLTRLQSLTNGIYRMMFCKDEISNEELFDKNVIIDLSRLGSTETKSLLMGMLVLKLQEYRMSSFVGTNQELKHVTILEEAHHLLKRTSTEQTSENSNLLGKSVEMIANSIAEMRTYGEGFIIADQAPGLLDMATIRNTNTKIIMRLPDKSDRELVGYSANLNDDQIVELAKLPRGVAAIYQNEWIQPVLCKVKKAEVDEVIYTYKKSIMDVNEDDNENHFYIADLLSDCKNITDENLLKDIKNKINKLHVDDSVKVSIIKWITNPPKDPRMSKLASIMAALFPNVMDAVVESYAESTDPREWTRSAELSIDAIANNEIDAQVKRDIIQSIITNYLYLELSNPSDLEKWSILGELS